MQTLLIDGRDYDNRRGLHQAIQRLLRLPPYYGCNADALYDCLTSRREQVNLWILHPGNEAVASALAQCAEAVVDAGGQVRRWDEKTRESD